MEWRVPKRGCGCVICKRNFSFKEEYCSAVSFKDEELVRGDFCLSCWEKEEKNFLIFWRRHHIEEPEEYEKEKVRKMHSAAEELFLRLEENHLQAKYRYILALILWRKRRLKFLRSKREDGRELMVFDFPREERKIEIEVPEITEGETENLKDELKKLLDGA